MKARLARSGHWSSVIGHLMVVSGGILRDGSLCVDLVIMDLATLAFIKSVVCCTCCSGMLCSLHVTRYTMHGVISELYFASCAMRNVLLPLA